MAFGIPFERDRFVGVIQITSSNNQFVIDVGSGPETKSIGTGEYWAYLSAGHELEADFFGFYDAFLTALDLTGATVSASTSLQSPLAYGGLRINTPNDASLTFLTSSNDWTLDPALLGIPSGADVSEMKPNVWVSPFCRAGEWLTPRHAQDKDGDIEHEQFDTGRDAHYRWESTETKILTYNKVPAALVRTSRALENFAYADIAGLAFGDNHNTFERLWTSTLSKKKKVLILHNSAELTDLGAGAEWEVARLFRKEQRDRLSSCFTARRRRLESFDIELAFESLARGYVRS